MRCKLLIVFLLTGLAMAVSNRAEAQFWKKWFHKDERKYKPVHKVATQPVLPKPKPFKRKLEVQYPETVKKSRYRIDVLAPLYLDELVKNDKPVHGDKIPEKAQGAIEFYEGVKLATDTLNSFNYNVDVYVHDIAAPTTSIAALIKDKVLDSADLIIGDVQSQQIPELAAFAKKRHVNFVSASSPSDAGVKDNPYFILQQPTLEAHCAAVMNTVGKKYHKKTVTLLYRTTVSVDKAAYEYVLEDSDAVKFEKIPCNAMPSRLQLKKQLDSTKTNVIVMPILENAYAEMLLKQLYQWFPYYRFEVYGMPSWRTMAGLKKANYFPNTVVYVTAPFYFDVSSAIAQQIERDYKSSFGGRPTELVFRSYETLYWYAYLLNQYGTIFNRRFNDNSATLFTKFEIRPKWDEKGNLLYNENQHLCLYRYQNSSYIVEQNK